MCVCGVCVWGGGGEGGRGGKEVTGLVDIRRPRGLIQICKIIIEDSMVGYRSGR